MKDKDLQEFAELVRTPATNNRHNVSTDECAEAPAVAGSATITVSNVKMWAMAGHDFFPCETAVDTLSPGQYVIKECMSRGIYFSSRDINLDDLLVLPDSNSELVISHINDFWNREPVFREYGFLWKRGILLWGPPGSGKTSTVQQLSKQIVDMGGITVYCVNPYLTAKGLELLRRIEPTRPIVVILEDMDAIIQQFGESDLLAMLDGELQIDNVVFVATTNYPQLLDKRFINRPSRFDEIIKIGMPSEEARRFYLFQKNPRLQSDISELEEWVNLTKGFSVAHLKELIISVECFNKSVTDATNRLKAMMETTTSQYADEEREGFGFNEN
jgi:AAA+ superfamily predicted ATPase